MSDNTSRKVPSPDELPEAPEVFDLVPDVEARLPSVPGEPRKMDLDLNEPDPMMERYKGRLPKVSELPGDWALVCLHAECDILPLKTTLPRLWEMESGQDRERVIAQRDQGIVMTPSGVSHVIDAMPQSEALDFVKWIESQVFISRKHEIYVETVVADGEVSLSLENQRRTVFVAQPMTSVNSFKAHFGVPIIFHSEAPDPGVIKRSQTALEDPSKLVESEIVFDREVRR